MEPIRGHINDPAQDFASGQSARSTGISGPTPSIEALRMVLGVACGAWSVGNQSMFLAGLDFSQPSAGLCSALVWTPNFHTSPSRCVSNLFTCA